MREFYRKELHELLDRAASFAKTVHTAVDLASTALLHGDADAARRVAAITGELQRWQGELDDRAIELMVRQQPVATDLRTIVAVMRIASDLRRMGVLAGHIAEISQTCLPHHAIPEVIRPVVADLASATSRLAERAVQIIETRDVEAALQMETQDDEIDLLQGALYDELLDHNSGLDKATAFAMALIGRYYERISDHAVSVARCLAFRAGEVTLD